MDLSKELITFQTAKRAKEKGFNELCSYHYSYGSGDNKEPRNGGVYIGGFIYDNGDNRPYSNSELAGWELPYGEFSAPSKYTLHRWLRENHSIDVVIVPERYSNGINYIVQAQKFDISNEKFKDDNFIVDGTYWYNDNGEYPTYEDAYEKGLFEGLRLIK